MDYKSTRNSSLRVQSAETIARGISEDGGLFVPVSMPVLTLEELSEMAGLPYAERAARIFAKFLTDFTPEELEYCTKHAYGSQFDTPKIAELEKISETASLLELWHGPTCAFKDMALQILPYFLTTAVKKLGQDQEIVILVATSGDTGKAALEGFKDVPGTRILVFYPEEGVSPMQKRQMRTQEGGNVGVCAVKGNFDDCQSGVKAIFTDPAVKQALEQNAMCFSSANSINWGRLAPQIVYYISAYSDLAASGKIQMGEPINIVVPTGNFGNILAAYYAKQMGLPVHKLICASNVNHVLTDFIRTGTYDRNRAFYATTSPSMDILISSNLERLLYLLSGGDDAQIRTWFEALAGDGVYTVTDSVLQALQKDFWGGFCDDAQTAQTIRSLYDRTGYTCDTHTAVGVKVYEDYLAETGDQTQTIIASTASPYKFGASVLAAVSDNQLPSDEYEMLDQLAERSRMEIPDSLATLKSKPVRFSDSIEKQDMRAYVLKQLGIDA